MRERRAETMERSIVSGMGQRVLDLRERGWTNARIAKHIGVDPSSVARLVTDPAQVPRHPAGESLIDLHANVMSGTSKWGRLINNLRIAGFQYSYIAIRCGCSIAYLHELKTDPTIVPNYELGEQLKRLESTYRKP
jgi:hypothetical protein